jgi:hypothetical protein
MEEPEEPPETLDRGPSDPGTAPEQRIRLAVAAALGLLEVEDVDSARAVLRDLLRR